MGKKNVETNMPRIQFKRTKKRRKETRKKLKRLNKLRKMMKMTLIVKSENESSVVNTESKKPIKQMKKNTQLLIKENIVLSMVNRKKLTKIIKDKRKTSKTR